MNIAKYLDSTYLKTSAQSGLSDEETLSVILQLTDEAIKNNIFAVMIRPQWVKKVKEYLNTKNSKVQIGTVIGFPEGTYTTTEKYNEAQKAIEDGADELDFVVNYTAFVNGELDWVKNEVLQCTQLCLDNKKIAKWIIEIAALSDIQIINLSQLITEVVTKNFPGLEEKVFIKSSTGFYVTENGKPNGATVEGIKLILKNAGKLSVKAAGGVRTHQEAVEMINLGVTRIGTSSAIALLSDKTTANSY